MRKILKKCLTGFMALTMMTALLPAQFALAAAENRGPEDYSVIYGTEGGYAGSDFKGQVFELQKNTDETKKYDYSVTVSLYNASWAYCWLSEVVFDKTVLKAVGPNGSAPMGNNFTASHVTMGTLGQACPDYADTSVAESIFQDSNIMYFGTTAHPMSELTADTVDSKYNAFQMAQTTSLSMDTINGVGASAFNAVRLGTQNSDYYEFQPPANTLFPLYTMYFKLQSGKSEADITPETFKFDVWDKNEKCQVSGSFIMSSDNFHYKSDTATYLIGFPKPAASDQTVKFTKIQNASGTALGAKIYLYTDAGKTQSVTVDGKDYIETAGDGSATVSLPGATTYWYKVTADNHVDYEGSFSVPEASGYNVDAITMTAVGDQKASATITVINADTGAALEDVTLTFDGSASAETTKTNASGQFTKELTLGSHTVKAELAGYSMYDASTRKVIESQSFDVKSSGGNNISIRMVPDRVSLPIPTVTGDKGSISGVKVSVEKLTKENKTDAWGEDGSDVQNYKPGETAQLPAGNDYSITISASGCNPKTVYVKTTDTGTEFYTDSTFTTKLDSSPFEGDFVLQQLSDPYYSVDISTTDDETYTAKVKLHNIPKAVAGTFGLQYDKTVFDYDPTSIQISENIQLHNPMDDSGDLAVNVHDAADEQIGYHVITWQGKKVDAASGWEYVEATPEGIEIATMTFTKKANASNKDITSDAFTVMPFDKTAEGVRVLTDVNNLGSVGTGRDLLDKLWRYCDEKNEGDENSLENGRIHKNKSILNGFYQVYPLVDDSVELEPVMHDVMTNITTNFEAEQGNLFFVVTDEATNVAISGAKVHLCDKNGEEITTLTTDVSGMVKYPVNSTSDESFKYWVESKGYWNEPDDLSPATMKDVTVKVKATQTEYVPMEKKIYHEAKLYDKTDALIDPATGDLKLSNNIAYNGRDFSFTVVPAAGKKLLKAVKDINFQVALDADGVEYKALVQATDYNAATNTWVVKGTLITGEPNIPDDINDVLGYKSHNIKVKIADPLNEVVTDDNTPHEVTANAGTNGGVIYTAGTGEIANEDDADGVKVTETARTDKADQSNYGKVTVSNIKPTETKKLGKFTFTADTNFFVEKVYVNGVDVSDLYEGKTTFDYTFDDLTIDNDITVTFWNGTTPSEDVLMTLVVGYNGKADVSKPETITGVTNTRKVFLNPADDLEFTAIADTGYELYQVRKSVDGKEPENITTSGTAEGENKKFTVAKPNIANNEKQIVVYVNFKDPQAEEPTYVMVKSYVKSGEGIIAPTGIFPLNKSFNFTVEMTPAKKAGSGEPASSNGNDWLAYAVDVNGTEYVNPNSNKRNPYEYTVTNIMTDTEIGAVFTETAYKVTGIVDLSQASEISLNKLLSGATVTCERVNPDTGRVNMTLKPVITTGVRNNSTFVVEMPAGKWNVTVSKRGYVDYQITGFEVGGDSEEITFGLKEGASDPKKITPYIGNATGTGKSVSLLDFGIISNGLRPNASTDIKTKGDVNNDDTNDINDVTYEKKNYGRRASTIEYNTWLNQ